MKKVRTVSWIIAVVNFFFGFLLVFPLIYSVSALSRAFENGIGGQDIEKLLLIFAFIGWIALTITMWIGILLRTLERNFFLRANLFWSLHCFSEVLWITFLSLGLFNKEIEYDSMEIGCAAIAIGMKVLSALASGLFIRLDRMEVDPGGGINSVPLRSTT